MTGPRAGERRGAGAHPVGHGDHLDRRPAARAVAVACGKSRRRPDRPRRHVAIAGRGSRHSRRRGRAWLPLRSVRALHGPLQRLGEARRHPRAPATQVAGNTACATRGSDARRRNHKDRAAGGFARTRAERVVRFFKIAASRPGAEPAGPFESPWILSNGTGSSGVFSGVTAFLMMIGVGRAGTAPAPDHSGESIRRACARQGADGGTYDGTQNPATRHLVDPQAYGNDPRATHERADGSHAAGLSSRPHDDELRLYAAHGRHRLQGRGCDAWRPSGPGPSLVPSRCRRAWTRSG